MPFVAAACYIAWTQFTEGGIAAAVPSIVRAMLLLPAAYACTKARARMIGNARGMALGFRKSLIYLLVPVCLLLRLGPVHRVAFLASHWKNAHGYHRCTLLDVSTCPVVSPWILFGSLPLHTSLAEFLMENFWITGFLVAFSEGTFTDTADVWFSHFWVTGGCTLILAAKIIALQYLSASKTTSPIHQSTRAPYVKFMPLSISNS
jgi:hypothetical protein